MTKYFLFFLGISSAVFAQDSCVFKKRSHPVQVKMKINYGIPQYKHLSNEFLAKKTANTHTLGFTEAALSMTFKINLVLNDNCVFLNELTVEYGYPHLVVSIDNFYPKDTCEYREILKHENKHVFIHQDALKEYAKKFGEAINAIAQTIPAEPVTTKEEAPLIADKMAQAIKSHPRLRVLEKQFEATIRQQNGELDRKESYRETKSHCENW
ncbi:MAG: hypothetical protein ACTSXV_01890 [Alphaproteobacteria bacterium]